MMSTSLKNSIRQMGMGTNFLLENIGGNIKLQVQ